MDTDEERPTVTLTVKVKPSSAATVEKLMAIRKCDRSKALRTMLAFAAMHMPDGWAGEQMKVTRKGRG